ncbi:MAG: hypothetical protein HY873_00570 [Chloroflexi bacterium]|nr:hypothetical protein [Chloroflexota bacterium]
MAEPKGRKKKRERERRRSGAPAAAVAQFDVDEAEVRAQVARQVQQTSVEQAEVRPMPSPTARASGFVLALVTGLLAVVMIYNGATGDAGGLDLVMRVVAGALLILLATVVAVLVLSPDTVRRIVWRRRG